MRINHVLVRASNIEAMNNFWIDIIGLKAGDRPPFPFPGSWLYSDGKPLIHVVNGNSAGSSDGVVDHVAFDGGDYEKLIKALRNHAVEYIERDVPASGERQVFVSAPDGLSVEMLFPLGTGDSEKHPY